MDKLEQYLDQVCRCIGGPWSMRQHVRQELRAHLLDAVEQHKAAGMSEAEAVAKAMEEFGKPEDVRTELEATHGQRMMAVVIDKAMQWKEKTMRAKWLWVTWAYLAMACVIVLEALFLTFIVVQIVPKFQKLMHDGLLDYAILEEMEVTWMPSFLDGLMIVTNKYTTFILIGLALLWGLFEWRIKSENKAFMRLSALGTAAVGLMVLIVLTAGTLLISFCLAMPAMGVLSRPFAVEQVTTIDKSATAIEQSLASKDWDAMQKHVELASDAMHRLLQGPAITSLRLRGSPPTVDELRSQVKSAHENLRAAQQAIAAKDEARATAALAEFRKAFAPVLEASKRPAP